jgi:uncharacterized protein (DUF2237 family)
MSISAKNILGTELQPCSLEPMTGFYRDGCCKTDASDQGLHVVCAVVTDAFLEFSRSRGNDLTTPIPMYDFPGLSHGDRWCLCALRWKEALDAGVAPPIVAESTNEAALRVLALEDLMQYAIHQ